MTDKEYVICIPSYKRANFCNNKTLATLSKHKIDAKRIFVYVANNEEFKLYETVLNPKLFNKIIIGKKGLVPQRQFIMNNWKKGKHIVFFDDDIESIDLTLSPRFKTHNLDYFIKDAFKECEKQQSFIWGVYPVFNPFFRKPRQELSSQLNYIVGAFYGIINRPDLKKIELTITKSNGQKEDVERTIKYFIEDGIVLRFNKIGFTTKYYGKEGGLGKFEERLVPMREACKKLEEKYKEYGQTKVRGNGMTEFVLKKIPSRIETNIKTKKMKNSNNKTRKKRN